MPSLRLDTGIDLGLDQGIFSVDSDVLPSGIGGGPVTTGLPSVSVLPTIFSVPFLPDFVLTGGWEVGQRTSTFSAVYPIPVVASLIPRDFISPTTERNQELTLKQERGDPRLPSWDSGSGLSETLISQDTVLYALYDMITAPALSLPLERLIFCCGLFDLSTSGLSPRRAFVLSAMDGTLDSLSWTSDSVTSSYFNTIRRASSSWDFMTAFDPVFLPLTNDLEESVGIILRNLDPVTPITQTSLTSLLPLLPYSDEEFAIVGGTTLSDSDYTPPSIGGRLSPLGLDLSAGLLHAPANVSSFLL